MLRRFYGNIKGRTIKSEKTITRYRLSGEMLTDYFGEDKDVTEITSIDIEKMYDAWSKKQMSATGAGKFQCIRSFFRYLLGDEIIIKNPTSTIRLNKKNREVDPLTETEILQIARKEIRNERLARVRDLAVIQAGVGMSFCDLMKLEPSDFLCEQGTFYIQRRKGIRQGLSSYL